ncbi:MULTISPECIES: GNAT family N-acetyltransferase [Clostridium]|jgi:diamine N-acetyltransferase|uniref:GNAT family N-acetyltransferase n=2 Tax=Clostridiaceae TaxID=31979 RepID=UPI00115B5D85|nr:MULTISPECIES: GNAT family N-acetyltransferase [Clostridium]MBS5307595.1 GNAT family N-acetyltransferase [Clostridium sp.]MDB1931833.1 GNAT family N-acetyltransferase [Clostridium tertium]MDB1935457.1 GNAT family N-acetyltransferase [Clostridium tertium]MDU1277591.1 GNAT family N-acetyltransferase [Clostridium sp.]MDU1568529.1 GNAT family N-acetyltransferase [Clostridium sp.]
MKLVIKEINDKNYNEALRLKVKKGQEDFIETVEECLNEAKQISLWRPVGIYNYNQIIGFAMYGLWENEGADGRVWLDRFMIENEFQGRGYGSESLKLILNRIYNEYNRNEIYLSIYENNDLAIKMYEKIGFQFNGELDINGEKIMKLEV